MNAFSIPSCVWVIPEFTATSSKATLPSLFSSLCSGIQQLLSPSVSMLLSRISVTVRLDSLKVSLDFSSLVLWQYVLDCSLAAAFPPFIPSACLPLTPGIALSVSPSPSSPDAERNRKYVLKCLIVESSESISYR